MAATTREHRNGSGPSAERAPDATAGAAAQARLVAALRLALRGDDGAPAALIETHISYVLLTGRHAYKLKKAIDLGFLDFRTLAARRFYCNEELRLNRRLAPDIYLDVVAVAGPPDAPVPGGAGEPVDYAVRMREFPQSALAAHALARGEFGAVQIDALAADIVAFHRAADAARAQDRLGAPETILDIALQNFTQMRPLARSGVEAAELEALENWTRAEFARCAPAMAARRRDGHVRECHGDLHLGNIALIDGRPLVFDCIEFNDDMRWIDVMSEIAFTTMDLAERGRPDLAHRFLDAYLAGSGDYTGLGVLRFYLVYRALVRAKIARLRAVQCAPGTAADALHADGAAYVRLAQGYAQPPAPALVLMHGLSGSGKTVVSQALLEAGGAVRVRTDVERKRLAGLAPEARGGSGIGADLYAAQATRATYTRVLALAAQITGAGWVALVDGAFLQRWQRALFFDWAATSGTPAAIVALAAPASALRARIAARGAEGRDVSDADLAVLDHQLETQEPLARDERAFAVTVDTSVPLDAAAAAPLWRAVRALLARSATVRQPPAGATTGVPAASPPLPG